MIRSIIVLAASILLCGAALAQTPQLVRQCVGTAASCIPISSTNPIPVAPAAAATGGATASGAIAPNNTTGVNLKASAGSVYSIQLGGIGAAPAYLKLYNKATAPTCGTDTPVKRLIIPAASTAALGGGSNVSFPAGVAFSLGIGYCVTTGITDADATAPAASTFLINIDWK